MIAIRGSQHFQCSRIVHHLMYIILVMISLSSGYSQQVVVNSGGYLKNHGAFFVLNTDLVNQGMIANTGSGGIRLAGDWSNNGIYSSDAETVLFEGNGSQTISGSSNTNFNNLIINNTEGVIADHDILVHGTLDLQSTNPSAFQGTLEMGSHVLFMGGLATTAGTGDVSGMVSRSSFIAGPEYSFGNTYTTLKFSAGGTLPSEVKFRISPGITPDWRTEAISRTYDIIRTGGSGNTVTLKLHYLDTELNGNQKNDLVIWDFHSSSDPIVVEAHSLADSSASFNWVSTSNLSIEHLASTIGDNSWSLSSSVYITFTGQGGWRMISAPNPSTYSGLFNGFITQGVQGSTYPLKQPNFLWYDETDSLTDNMSWRIPGDMDDPTVNGKGLYFYIFDTVSGPYNDTLPRRMTATGNAYFPVPGEFSYSGFNQEITYSPVANQQLPSGANDTVYYDTHATDMGWNLIGNPTQSTLDWDADGWTKTNIDNSIYIWDPEDEEFKVWNGSVGTLENGLISPFQAFWVKADFTNPALSFTDDALTSGGSFYRGKTEEKKMQTGTTAQTISLTLKALGIENHALVTFDENAVTGPDKTDAYRLEPLTNQSLELFTLSSVIHNLPLVINSLPAGGQDYFFLPLFMSLKKDGQDIGGTFTLAWEMSPDWPSDWSVSLQDNTSREVVSMLDESSYQFSRKNIKNIQSPGKGYIDVPALPDLIVNPVSGESLLKSSTELAPFAIIISKKTTSDDPVFVEQTPAFLPNYPNPFLYRTTLRFSLPVASQVKISVYDMYGRLAEVLTDDHFEAGIHSLNWNCEGFAPGVYFAYLQVSGSVDVIKLIISTR
jgi:hypothetical protein